jgi:hypothetical protein
MHSPTPMPARIETIAAGLMLAMYRAALAKLMHPYKPRQSRVPHLNG